MTTKTMCGPNCKCQKHSKTLRTDNACPHCGLQCNGDIWEMQAKIARVTDQLARLMQVAETACRYLDQGGSYEDELYSGKEGWVTDTEIDEVCAKLTLIKEEIK